MASKVIKPQNWTQVKRGDIVDIIAPASGSTVDELHGAIEFVEEFGLVPRVQKNIFGKDLLCANSDKVRFQQFQKAILAKDSSVVWCLRGGYGCNRIMNQVMKMKRPNKSKAFIGYSDITTLHLYMNHFWNWPTIHGNMLESLGQGEGGRRELTDFTRILFGDPGEIEYFGLRPLNVPARKKTLVRSKIIGGNMMVMQSSLGAPYQANAKGKIVFFEEIDERGYRIDRMLVHFLQSGFFTGCRGVVFGDIVGGEEEDGALLWKEVKKEFAAKVSFPVLKGLPCGHVSIQRPLPFNSTCVLQLGNFLASLKVHYGSKKAE